MTADVTREPTGGQELREAIAEHLMREYEQEYTVTEPVSAWYPQAERILAMPEVAALIADAEKARNLRELHTRDDTEPYACDYCGQAWPCDPINALDREAPASRDRLSAPGTRSERPAHLSTPATGERRSAGSTAVARGSHGETTEPEERQ